MADFSEKNKFNLSNRHIPKSINSHFSNNQIEEFK